MYYLSIHADGDIAIWRDDPSNPVVLILDIALRQDASLFRNIIPKDCVHPNAILSTNKEELLARAALEAL